MSREDYRQGSLFSIVGGTHVAKPVPGRSAESNKVLPAKSIAGGRFGSRYVVELPEVRNMPDGYGELDYIGRTSARSPARAVQNVVFRQSTGSDARITNSQAQLIFHALRLLEGFPDEFAKPIN